MSANQFLETASVRSVQHNEPELKGWLQKWTNYLKGYQKRWFVLNNGCLYYYRNPMEMNQSCRGAIKLVSAVFHAEDNLNFVVANGSTQAFHLRASNEMERTKWVSALELAKVRAIRQMDAEDDDMFDLAHDKDEVQAILKTLQSKLDSLTSCFDVVTKHANSLNRSLIELEQIENPAEAVSKSKAINERATVYRITSSAMINASVEYLNCAQTHHKKLQKLIQHEHESRLKLEDLVEQLAKQHSFLEQKAIKQQKGEQSAFNRRDKTDNDNTEDDEFFDAEENVTAEFVVTFPGKAHRIHSSSNAAESLFDSNPEAISFEDSNGSAHKERRNKPRHLRKNKSNNMLEDNNDYDETYLDDEEEAFSTEDEDIQIDVVTRKSSNIVNALKNSEKNNDVSSSYQEDNSSEERTITPTEISNGTLKSNFKNRRMTIPIRPNHSLNLWSIMKNCIGKELTKIPMPVNFNEPLSMLQRMTEEFEYADILHKAAKITDPLEQLAYVAVFSVTCYATTSTRTSKPFNPLLGETFECDRRDDLGWRCISEQVSHHPPMLAQYCEGRDWTCWREFAMMSKFRGKYLQINPMDITHLEFPSGNHYTWRKVTTTVHNIIVGKLWVDNYGDMTITNHHTGDTCHLTFSSYSYFSREIPRKVTGVVFNKDNEIKWVLNGSWDAKMEISKVVSSTQKTKGSKPVIETGTPKLIWKRTIPPAEYEKMYNMTVLAVQLNEPEEGIAPTDSRLRPDQRLMEDGDWDKANEAKVMLEEKQRATRRQREEEAERAASEGRPYVPYEPTWFKKSKDPITGSPVHIYNHEYWNCKESQHWARCPNIYSN